MSILREQWEILVSKMLKKLLNLFKMFWKRTKIWIAKEYMYMEEAMVDTWLLSWDRDIIIILKQRSF